MATLTLTETEIRTSALALAATARRTPRGEEVSRVKASRRVADTLAESYPTALARGQVLLTIPDECLFALAVALYDACDGWPLGRPAGYSSPLPIADPGSLLRRLRGC